MVLSIKVLAGSTTLTGANSYSGSDVNVNVRACCEQVRRPMFSPEFGSATIASNGTLDLNGLNQTVSRITNGLVNIRPEEPHRHGPDDEKRASPGSALGTIAMNTFFWRRFAVGQACHQRRQRDRQFVVAHHQCGRAPAPRRWRMASLWCRQSTAARSSPPAFTANPTTRIGMVFWSALGCSRVVSTVPTPADWFLRSNFQVLPPHQRRRPLRPHRRPLPPNAADFCTAVPPCY